MDGEYLGDNNKKTQYVYVVSAGGYRQYKKGHYAITRNKAIQLRDNKNNPITKMILMIWQERYMQKCLIIKIILG